MITLQDIYNSLNGERGDIPVAEIMSQHLVACLPEETLKDALEKLGEWNIGRIPVVEPNDREHLIGLITRKGIIEAYNNELHKKEKK